MRLGITLAQFIVNLIIAILVFIVVRMGMDIVSTEATFNFLLSLLAAIIVFLLNPARHLGI